MALTIKEVEDIAFAAKLNLTEEEKRFCPATQFNIGLH